MSQTFPIRAITADEFPALAQVAGEAFLQSWEPEAVELERQVLEYDRTIAAFDGERMVSSAGAYSYQLTVPGGSVPAAGITLVAVLPSHRRRGILTAMMQHLISDAVDRNEPVAILFASEAGIYRRFGFGQATSQLQLRLHRGYGTIADADIVSSLPAPRLREAEPAKVSTELAASYETARASRPGQLARDERWWPYVLDDPEFRRGGMSQLRCLVAEDDNGPRGYALYRTKPDWTDGIASGTLRIRELIAADPAATAALWRDLLSRDLVGEVVAPIRPVDDPLLSLLADPRRARATVSDGLWVRLIDLPAALSQRSYAAEIDIVLEVADAGLPANAGRWRLQASPGADGVKASCERTSAAADLDLSVQALGAGYLGSQIGQLAAAGQIRELTPGAVGRLSAAMSHDPAPWSCMIF
jgi:predicted acetyltransferase